MVLVRKTWQILHRLNIFAALENLDKVLANDIILPKFFHARIYWVLNLAILNTLAKIKT